MQVRKNTAAAAIKTRDWTIAISSCDTVLGMDPNCTKSLYRRALANWHLGEVEKANADLEAILKKPVTDYNMIAEASEVKKLARSVLRQIEASEERAEVIEQKMARALTATIPITGASVGGGPAPLAQDTGIAEASSESLPRLDPLNQDSDDNEWDGPILEEEEA